MVADRRRRGIALAVAVVVAAVLGFAAPALAAFFDDASTTTTIASATLQPPTDLAGTAGCSGSVPNVRLTWTPTPSTWADGYELDRATTAMGPWLTTSIVGAATSSHTVEGLPAATTFYFRLRAVRLAWRSTDTSTVTVTTRLVNLGGLCV